MAMALIMHTENTHLFFLQVSATESRPVSHDLESVAIPRTRNLVFFLKDRCSAY